MHMVICILFLHSEIILDTLTAINKISVSLTDMLVVTTLIILKATIK